MEEISSALHVMQGADKCLACIGGWDLLECLSLFFCKIIGLFISICKSGSKQVLVINVSICVALSNTNLKNFNWLELLYLRLSEKKMKTSVSSFISTEFPRSGGQEDIRERRFPTRKKSLTLIQHQLSHE